MKTALGPKEATAARQQLADDAMALLVPALSQALAQVYVQAVKAASNNVIVAASTTPPTPPPSEPFSPALVGATLAALAVPAPGWLFRRVSDWVNALAGQVYEKTVQALYRYQARSRPGANELIRDLNKVLAVEKWETWMEAIVEDAATDEFNRRQLAALTQAGATHKRWHSRRDDRTRATHAAAHGQRVPIGEGFVVGYDQLLFPGDPSGSPGEVRNCRCVVVPG